MKAALLVLGSICVGLLLCETALRLFTRFNPAASAELAATALTPDKPLDLEGAAPYIAKLSAAPGTDRRWFRENPPPLPNRSPLDPKNYARYRDYQRRGALGAQADYVWNRIFAEATNCTPASRFQNFPGSIRVFDPPSANIHPIYRFPANTTTTGGLVTNQFGFRGPPLALAKPPKTIRIAFVGASTTSNNHDFPFSYPERVTYWLNRFAAANRLDVRFEGLNAGREGINSEDMPSIVQYELLPLDPDLAVYYEGSNQFPTANQLVAPPIPARPEIDPLDPLVEHPVPELIRAHFAVGNLLDLALNGFKSISEPRKPSYRLQWPNTVDERNPDVNRSDLPLQLPIIIKNLDSIRDSLASIGGQLALCSFEWLANDGMPLSPTRHQYIYRQLNTVLWPLRYADIRRLAAFQNRVFQRYAETRKIPFLDVASSIPPDPNLFIDAIHMTDTGERVKAWIVFQQLVPLIRSEIKSGRLPHSATPDSLPPLASMKASEMSLGCSEKPFGNLARIDNGLSISRRVKGSSEAVIESGNPLKVTTPDRQWAYAAWFAIQMPPPPISRVFAFIRARVLRGQVGIGVLDQKGNTFLVERSIGPGTVMEDIYLPVRLPDRADVLIFRNAAPDGVRSEILIEDVQLLTSSLPRTK